MLKHLIPIVALALVLPACTEDGKKSNEKPTGESPSAKVTAPSAADTEPTAVASDPSAVPVAKGGAVDRASAVAASAKAPDTSKQPAGKGDGKLAAGDKGKAGDCVAECVQANQMRAVGADQIESDCKIECVETDKCVADCVKKNQMRAVAPEQIESDCKADCAKK